jgi:hypothetical protein
MRRAETAWRGGQAGGLRRESGAKVGKERSGSWCARVRERARKTWAKTAGRTIKGSGRMRVVDRIAHRRMV